MRKTVIKVCLNLLISTIVPNQMFHNSILRMELLIILLIWSIIIFHVQFAIKLFFIDTIKRDMKEFTLVKNPLLVLIVTKKLPHQEVKRVMK